MSLLPKSIDEVKQILTVRDLQTGQCSGFLAGDHSLCPWPVFSGKWPDGKNGDAGSLVDCVEISALPFEDPGASPEPQVIYRRSVQDKDPLNLWLQIAKTRAKAAERGNEPDPERVPGPEPDPPRAPTVPVRKQGQVVPFPKKKRPEVLGNKPPADVVKYASNLDYRGKWLKTLQIMYAKSKYINIKSFKHYHGKHDRKGRFFYEGNDELVRLTGQVGRTLIRHHKWMKEQGLIRKCRRGFPEQGASVWELPLNMKQVFAWRKNPKIKTK